MWTKDYGNNLFCNARACLLLISISWNGQGSHFITICILPIQLSSCMNILLI